jgi:hypothetical protein
MMSVGGKPNYFEKTLPYSATLSATDPIWFGVGTSSEKGDFHSLVCGVCFSVICDKKASQKIPKPRGIPHRTE